MQDWSELAGKKVFFIADAPCHGSKYHDCEDYYPEGSPEGLVLEDLMLEFQEKDIDFNIVKLDNSMNGMIEAMKASHDSVEVQDFSEQMEIMRTCHDVTETTAVSKHMSAVFVSECTGSLRRTVEKSRKTCSRI